MIRLPPSSISLAEHDLAFHSQQIDVYHGLLKQGFKKKDIVRYFKEHREANVASSSNSHDSGEFIEPALSCFDLTVKSISRASSSRLDDEEDPSQVTREESSSHRPLRDDVSSGRMGEQELAAGSSSSAAPAQVNHRHAPRQSSLLRFAEAVSSDSSMAAEESPDVTRVVPSPAKSYRPRTERYSSFESEFSDSEFVGSFQRVCLNSVDQTELIEPRDHLQRCTSPLRPEAESFVLESCTQPKSESLRSTPAIPSSVEDADTCPQLTPADHVPSSLVTPRKSSLGATHQPYRLIEFPSSPPSPDLNPRSRPLPHMLTTPNRPTPRESWTEPRSQGFDGSFAVYKDAIPSLLQPQTPAELVRQSIITEHEAAYTAPVGMIRGLSTNRQHRHPFFELETGEESPTARAIGMRERRARELLRSVRAESLRFERLRLQDMERMTRGIDGNLDITDRGRARDRERDDGPGPAIFTEPWEDELEADRVGAENWEGEETGLERRTMRVTSGNARRWWVDREL
jgi:hypothetical protein